MNRKIDHYYTIDLTGNAIIPVLDKSWNIDSIRVYSTMFDNDLVAMEEMQHSIDGMLDLLHVQSWTDIIETIDYNPDFFPSLKNGKDLTEVIRQKEEAEFRENEMSESLEEEGKIALMVTTAFDSDGDNVNSRWCLESPTFKIVGKVVTDINDYLEQKALKKIEFKDSFWCFKTPENPDEDILYN